MKTPLYLIFLVLFIVAMVSSCSKDKDTSATEKFSTLSVEANKATVENAGVDLVKVMERMKSIESVDVINKLGDLVSSSGKKGYLFSKDSKLFSALETFAVASKGERRLNDVFDAMVSSKDLKGDPESIKKFWDDNVGTYTCNKSLNEWTIVLGGNKFIFLFPSSDVATSNDATLTIYNYTGIKISNPIDEDYTGDLPVSLNADLKVGSKTLITFTFAASYNTDGVPNAIASDLTIENYKFEIDIANTTKVVSVNYKLLENNSVILDMGISGEGLFTESNFDANTITHSETHTYVDYVWNPTTQQYVPTNVTYTDTWKETDFEEIINSASAHFQLLNVAIRGDVNIKGLVDQLKLIDKDRENKVITDETADNRYAAKINEFMNLRLVNVTSNQIMAKAEAYVVKETNYGYVDTYIDFRLTFSDGSPIDLETYTNSGFKNFVNELNGLINDINTDFDLDMDHVNY